MMQVFTRIPYQTRRIGGSLMLAVLFLLGMYGVPRWLGDPRGVAYAAVAVAIVWLIGYLIWPALAMIWASVLSPAAQRAYQPTWGHVIGASAISLALHGLVVALLLTMSTRLTVEWEELPKSLLRVGLVGYLLWPAIAVTWRRRRGGQPAPR